jgi:hypothetical protein
MNIKRGQSISRKNSRYFTFGQKIQFRGYSFTLYYKDGRFIREYYDIQHYNDIPDSSECFSREEFISEIMSKPKNWFRELIGLS